MTRILKMFFLFMLMSCSVNTYAQKINADTLNSISKKTYKTGDETIDDINTKIENNKTDFNNSLASNKQDIKDLLNVYVWGIVIIFTLLGFLINFFGKTAIKNRVEEIISETAKGHVEKKIVSLLNSKITDELIKESIREKGEVELNKILAAIENKGNTTIDDIKEKGYNVINSMLAPPTKTNPIKADPTDAEIKKHNDLARLNELFNMAYVSKNPRVSIELYNVVIKIDPKNYNAYNNIGVHYNDINQHQKAIEALNEAIKLNANIDSAYSNRANAYNKLNQLDLAIIDAEHAISLNPRNEFAYAIKGNIYTKQNKFLEAEEALNMAIKINPNSPEAFFNRGFFYEERHAYQKSEEDYVKAEELGMANKATLYNNFAVLYRRQKNFNKAIVYIQKAREADPNLPNLDGTLALIYADEGKDDEFYVYLKSALEKGCPVWDYLSDSGFDKYRNTEKLNKLIEPYKNLAAQT